MPTTTPNFGWSVPVSTDLVKDGATAIELLGDSIDASLVDLKGGTTGQYLAKASGTDMDFTWATDVSGIPATIFDAKGDIIAASAADTAARLAVGANNTVLTADSTTATGLKWAAPAGGGKILQVVTATHSTQASSTSATYADSGLTATITPIATSSRIFVTVSQPVSLLHTSSAELVSRFNIMRASTQILENEILLRAAASGSELASTIVWSPVITDSPATTSATTYKCQLKRQNDAGTVFTSRGGFIATITLMEIGA